MWGTMHVGRVQESTEAEHLAGPLVTCPGGGMRIWDQGPAIGGRGKSQFHGVRDIRGGTGGLLGKLKIGS